MLGCVDCGAMCTWDPADRDTHPDAARRPVAGWHEDSPGRWLLAIGPAMAEALSHDGYWSADVGEITVASGTAPSLAAAQLAAEDALRAIAAEILRAVGK